MIMERANTNSFCGQTAGEPFPRTFALALDPG